MAVEEQKKKATTSREQVDRAFYAKSALFFAISSGSLELYGHTLAWAHRYVRDPVCIYIVFNHPITDADSFSVQLVANSIFAHSATHTSEEISLLSGIPKVLEDLRSSDIASRILVSNKIMLNLFETVCSALKEPSFNPIEWCGPLELAGEVVLERLAAAKRVQDTLLLSDDQLYEVLWSDRLDLLLKIEGIGL